MKVLEKNGQVIEGNFEEKEVKEAFWPLDYSYAVICGCFFDIN